MSRAATEKKHVWRPRPLSPERAVSVLQAMDQSVQDVYGAITQLQKADKDLAGRFEDEVFLPLATLLEAVRDTYQALQPHAQDRKWRFLTRPEKVEIPEEQQKKVANFWTILDKYSKNFELLNSELKEKRKKAEHEMLARHGDALHNGRTSEEMMAALIAPNMPGDFDSLLQVAMEKVQVAADALYDFRDNWLNPHSTLARVNCEILTEFAENTQGFWALTKQTNDLLKGNGKIVISL